MVEQIKIKKVGEGDVDADVEFLFGLRNEPTVFEYARNNRPVEKAEHLAWIEGILTGQSNKTLFIVEFEGQRAGQIRFDKLENGVFEISIALAPDFRGRGVGKKALQLGVEKVKLEQKAEKIIAVVNKQNIGSLRFFEKANFILQNQEGDWLTHILEI